MMGIRRLLAVAGGIILCGAAVLTANAESYDIAAGDITITAAAQGQTVTYLGKEYDDSAPVITGSTQENSVLLMAEEGQRLYVTLEDLDVDFSAGEKGAPVVICGEGSAVVKLSGASTLKASAMNAAVDVRTALYLCNAGDETGELTAQGGAFGAGIGGGAGQSASEISVLSGKIHALGGAMAAGIGGGQYGDACRIAVLGGEVEALGGGKAAGIGAGWCGSSAYITLMGGKVTASGETAVGSTEDAICVDIASSDAQRQLRLDDEETALIDAGEAVQIPAECRTLCVEEAESVQEPEAEEETAEEPSETEESTEETAEAEETAEEPAEAEENTEEPEKTEQTAQEAPEEPDSAEKAEEAAAEDSADDAQKNQLTFVEEKPETAAAAEAAADETEPSETAEETQAETEAASATEETEAQEASEEETKPEEKTDNTASNEKTEEPEISFTTETLSVLDDKGNCQEFTVTRNNNTLQVGADSKDVQLKFSAEDVKLWQDNGIYILQLSFGGKNARTTVPGIAKWMNEKTQEAVLHIPAKGGMSLVVDGVSRWLP